MTEPEHPIDWDGIRARYEAGVEPVKVLAADAGLSTISLSLRALRLGWKMRGAKKTKAESTAATLKRMKELLQSRLTDLETQLQQLNEDVSELSSERNIRAANMLVRTLEKVLDLERKDKLRRRSTRFKHFDDAERAALADKIERLQGAGRSNETGETTAEPGSARAEPPMAILGEDGPAAA